MRKGNVDDLAHVETIKDCSNENDSDTVPLETVNISEIQRDQVVNNAEEDDRPIPTGHDDKVNRSNDQIHG